ncbi:universal stress protein [Oculatella sp. FACHB-28]|uniref:universal stress protein n=1 Tax=Oculatella sp. FACHB-28 TaxID=2692845 RepID=UPI001683DB8E|nr:universal stress protein [Oculatella sp. FACHB-28]MBD2060147.1 universal stress protein [Oculatella sp. FACHB-28]
MSFKRILVAVDHAALSQPVFEQALELAQTNRSKLLLCHCLTADVVTTSPTFAAGELGLSAHFVSQTHQAQYTYLEQQIEAAKALLSHYGETATRQGIATEINYRVADPGQGLCEIAKNWNADLIVVGRRGRKGLTEAILGSVSNYVLHHASCAVLIIQAPTAQASLTEMRVEGSDRQPA